MVKKLPDKQASFFIVIFMTNAVTGTETAWRDDFTSRNRHKVTFAVMFRDPGADSRAFMPCFKGSGGISDCFRNVFRRGSFRSGEENCGGSGSEHSTRRRNGNYLIRFLDINIVSGGLHVYAQHHGVQVNCLAAGGGKNGRICLFCVQKAGRRQFLRAGRLSVPDS
ncbi:hypothetical protein GGR01_001678 [Acetobacter oeni]|nr:hypothetical protein [Acetobacter oeni]